MLMSSLGSPVTLRCHSKGAAHIAAAKTSHYTQRPAAIGPQLRQAAMWAVVQPDSEHDPLADESQMPLIGKRIMITAPRQYAHKLAAYLVMAGARPVWVPSISITHIWREDKSKFDEQMQSLSQYDHIAFTSRNGIYAVMQRLEELQGSAQAALQALNDSKVQCWALGADAQLLRAYGVQSVQTPAEASTQGLVRELQKQGRAQGARVLCPVPLVTAGLVEPPVVPKFLEALQAAGAEAVRLDVYQTSPGSDQAACVVERQLLRSGGIHAIAFSSTAEAQGLTQIMGGAEAIRDAVHDHSIILAAHGPYTAAGAGAVLGCHVQCINQDFSSFAGLVTALEHAFASQG